MRAEASVKYAPRVAPSLGGARVATNRKCQVVPDLDKVEKRWSTLKGGPYELDKKWPGAATGGPRPARQ